ncbi:MAG: phospholipid carrier-dependent glycosyltransferase [Anaerolineales bacterium]|nr:MAG: phospholipid carrier-dependent glycosyltransferase [Anaerolineales bacterium]
MTRQKLAAFINKNSTKILVLGIFLAGLGIRLYDITDEPLEFHPTRQLRSAIISRGFYYHKNPNIPSDQVEFAEKQAGKAGLIEPPILEYLTAQTYRIVGKEQVWVGRIFSIFFWLLGGWALYAFSRDISTLTGSVVALIIYFLLPFSIIASRTLMPDPMMVAFTVISIWAVYEWEKKRSLRWAILTGLVTGFAILSKSVAGVVLIFPFAFFILSKVNIKSALKNRQLWLIAILAALPSVVYFLFGIFIDRRLATQFSGRFFPSLNTDPAFYVQWLLNIDEYFSLIFLVLGVVGIALVKEHKIRWLLVGWWAGYLVYGFMFPYHIMTHSYYHLPLVPIISASLAPLAARLTDLVNQTPQKRFSWAIILTAFGIFITFNLWSVKHELKQEDYRTDIALWEEIADVLYDQPGSVIALTADYGTSLKYYGMVSPRHWPSIGDIEYSIISGGEKTFDQFWENKTSSVHFFLVADLDELEKQPELQERLEDYEIFAEGEGYVILDLKTSK